MPIFERIISLTDEKTFINVERVDYFKKAGSGNFDVCINGVVITTNKLPPTLADLFDNITVSHSNKK